MCALFPPCYVFVVEGTLIDSNQEEQFLWQVGEYLFWTCIELSIMHVLVLILCEKTL